MLALDTVLGVDVFVLLHPKARRPSADRENISLFTRIVAPWGVSRRSPWQARRYTGILGGGMANRQTVTWHRTRPLFPGAAGKPIAPRTLDRVWTEAREAAGLPALRLHDLRHSGLTWTAQTGASVAEPMYRAGHSSPATAMRYQHATQARDSALAKELSKLVDENPQTRAGKTAKVDAE